jgi:hypothetical protein
MRFCRPGIIAIPEKTGLPFIEAAEIPASSDNPAHARKIQTGTVLEIK